MDIREDVLMESLICDISRTEWTINFIHDTNIS